MARLRNSPKGHARKRIFAPLAGFLLACALVAGCAPSRGAAATVDGAAISEGEVAEVVAELSPYVQIPLSPAAALSAIVVAPSFIEVASEAGIGVSESDAESLLSSMSQEAGLAEPDMSDSTILVTRYILATQGIQADGDAQTLLNEVAASIAALDIDLSPRYGQWQGQFAVAETPTWIVTQETEQA